MGGGNSRNFIIAIVLSIAVLFAWQYFVAQPQLKRAQQEAAQQAQTETVAAAPDATTSPPAAGDTVAQPAAVATTNTETYATREAAIAAGFDGGTRVEIRTPSLSGSVNLVGARIDDLSLTNYSQCVDSELYPCPAAEEDPNVTRDSPIVLLSPRGAPNSYFADWGWVRSDGTTAVGVDSVWTAPAGAVLTNEQPLTLTYDAGDGLVFTRTISVDEDYMFTVSDSVVNNGAGDATLTPYGRVTRFGDPATRGFFILHEGPVGYIGGQGLKEVKYSALEGGAEVYDTATTGWLGITDKYWAAALIPAQGQPFNGEFRRISDAGGLRFQADFSGARMAVPAGGSITLTNNLFAGAKEVKIIDSYNDSLNLDHFNLIIDWGWFYFITQPMFALLDWLYGIVGNFGVAILIATVLLKLLFFPLANRSYRSMAAMRKVTPQVQAARERYKDDRAKQQQVMLEIYRKEKINPIAGCWPILLQIPVFFSLYKVLFVTIEMRHQPFFGWIQDLSSPDPTSFVNLFGLLPFDPPSFLAIGVWPILMGITMWVQMKLTPQQPGTPTFIFNILPIVFTFMLSSFPAGLVIYWAWNNTLSVLQQSVIMRRHGVKVELFGNIRNTFKRKPKKADAKT